MQKKRLAIVSTHPIQYNAPLFRVLAQSERIELKVFYTWSQAKDTVADKEFGREIKWDIPLLDGYDYEFIENISRKPKQKFGGLVNPDLIPSIENWHPDALLIFGWNFSSHFKAMRYFHGKIPVWFRGDSTLLDERPGLKTMLRRMVLKYVYSYVDHAFYVGENNKKYFIAHGLKNDQMSFAPHAVDNTRFGCAEAKAEGKLWRNKLGYSNDDIVMVFAGKIYGVKNMIDFSHQFKNYVENNPDSKLRLLIVGNGVEENQLAMHTHILRLPFQNQSKMPGIYNLGDVFVLPSISETWGLAVNEAMAAGKPVVVTRKVGCAIDLIENNTNGFYFDLINIPDTNQVMFERIEKADLISIGSRNSMKISKWSHEEIAEAIERLLTNH